MNAEEIRKTLCNVSEEIGYELDELETEKIPKKIRLTLYQKVLSISPSDEMVQTTYDQFIKLYFSDLDRVIVGSYFFKPKFKEIIMKTITLCWPRKQIQKSNLYFDIYDKICILFKRENLFDRIEKHIEHLPFTIEKLITQGKKLTVHDMHMEYYKECGIIQKLDACLELIFLDLFKQLQA